MKPALKQLATPLLFLVVAHATALAQVGKKAPRPVEGRTTTESTAKTRKSTADELREHQLRIFRELVLARALDNIKTMAEPGLRLSGRIQLLTYLTSDKNPTDEQQGLATQIARDALTDLREHHEKITPFMFGYLSTNLRSWIQKHRPNLIDDFENAIKSTEKVDASQHIRSLFELENGDVLAAKRILQELEDQGSLDALYFWLDELMRRNSKEFETVASDVVVRAARGQISFQTLFWISDIYLRPQVSKALRNRFLSTVIARTQPANFVVEPAPQSAHDLLTKLLPVIQQSSPELYDQAQNHSFAIRAGLTERQLANDARIKRLQDSADPIGDLKTEAASAKTKAERNELLLRAAELAVEKKKFQLCLDILDDLDVDVIATDPIWQHTIDQLLKNLVRACLTNKIVATAEKGAARIGSLRTRVESFSLIIRYYAKADEKEAAQRLLIEASKVAASSPDNPDKAKAFLLLSVVCDQINGFNQADLLLSGIKAMNNLSTPDGRDKTGFQAYIERLDNLGYELSKAFKALTVQDENAALALVDRLQKPDLRTFALIGLLLGLEGRAAKASL